MDYTTRLGLSKPDPDPETGDFVDIQELNDNADKIDAGISFTVCLSTSRPAVPFQGQAILETDTGSTYVWGGSGWLPLLVGSGAFNGRIGVGVGASTLPARLLRTWGPAGSAVSQVFLQTAGTATGNRAISMMGADDSKDRWFTDFDGRMQWAGQDLDADVVLYRRSVNQLATQDWITSWRTDVADWAFGAGIEGEPQPRFLVKNGGTIEWGPGSATTDVNLYRNSSTRLRTDDNFSANGFEVNGNTARVMTDLKEASASSGLALVSGSFVDVPGCTVTVTTRKSGALLKVLWSTDFDLPGSGTGLVAHSICNVAGVDQGPNAVWEPGNVSSGRATIGQFHTMTLGAAGSYIVKQRAKMATGANGVTTNSTHTRIMAEVFE